MLTLIKPSTVKKVKKILHLIDSLAIGGAQMHLLTILKCVDRERYFHIVYSLTDRLDIKEEIEGLGIKVISLSLQEALKKKRWAVLVQGVFRMFKNEMPDILETHLTWSRIFGTIGAIVTGTKRIISFEQGEIYNNSLKYKIVNFLISFFIDIIITNSNAMKKWLHKNYGLPYSKIEVMYNCVLTDFFKPKGNSKNYRRALGISQDEILIGSVGTLGRGINKGMNFCIDAMSILSQKHRNIRLIIVGDGELRSSLEQQVKDLKLEGMVKFLGFRRDTDLILNTIDIFVLASIFEPFGIALIEAMAMEKPVIGSASGGIPEIIENGVNGFLFSPRDSKHLSEIIDILINDENLRREIGLKARRSVEDKFEARKYTKKIQSIYDVLLKTS